MKDIITAIQDEDYAYILNRARQMPDEERYKMLGELKNINLERDILHEERPKDYNKKFYERRAAKNNVLTFAQLVCLRSFKDLKLTASEWDKNENLLTAYLRNPENEMSRLIEYFEMFPPDYLDRLVEQLSKDRQINNYFPLLWQLYKKGWVTFNEEIFVRSLFIIPMFRRETAYDIQFIQDNPEIVEKVLRHFHKYEIPVLDTSKWQSKKGGVCATCTDYWDEVFMELKDKGLLNDRTIIRDLLGTLSYQWKKGHLDWHVRLIRMFEPAKEEYLAGMDMVFAAMHSVNTTVINYTISVIREIYNEKGFDANSFFQAIPHVLTREKCDKGIMTALDIADRIMEGHPDRNEYAAAVANAFLQPNAKIQELAAKIITRHTLPDDDIKQALSAYSDRMLSGARTILSRYMDEDQQQISLSCEKKELIREENMLSTAGSIEDFIFFASQAINIPEPYHFDLLLGELVKWGNAAGREHVILFEPVLQRAYKNLSGWETGLVQILSNVMVHYGEYLDKKYPGGLSKIEKLRKKVKEWEKEAAKRSRDFKSKLVRPSDMNISTSLKGLSGIAATAIDKIEQQDTLPILSSPTHLPMWIDPAVLVERLAQYQDAGKTPADLDMQLAIQRCALDQTTSALELSGKLLKGEFGELMSFLLGKDTLPKGRYDHPSWWMTAGMTRSPEKQFDEFNGFEYQQIPFAYRSGMHEWEAYMKEYQAYGNYNLQKKDYERNTAYTPTIRFKTTDYYLREKGTPLFMEYVAANPSNLVNILSQPNNPGNIFGKTAYRLLQWSSWEVSEIETAQKAAGMLQQLDIPFRDMEYLFLAAAILGFDKTARNYACQIWSERVSCNFIDSALLGHSIGKIEALEVCPLKRFTDLVMESMIGISQQHNRELQVLIENILLELKEPIKNLKKLIEAYHEVLITNHAVMPDKIREKIYSWQENGTLRKIIKTLFQ